MDFLAPRRRIVVAARDRASRKMDIDRALRLSRRTRVVRIETQMADSQMVVRRRLLIIVFVACCASSSPQTRSASTPNAAVTSADSAWDQFWRSHGVTPAPPRDFLDSPDTDAPEILNLTDGAIDDMTARRWVEGDRRRGRGDSWAGR